MRYFIFYLLFALSFCATKAGPVGMFRTDTGGLIKGEVMFVDDNNYYCQKVSDRSVDFTVKVEDVPLSFKRRVDHLVLKGELQEPPEDISVSVEEVPVDTTSSWTVKDYRDDEKIAEDAKKAYWRMTYRYHNSTEAGRAITNHEGGVVASIEAKDDQGKVTYLRVVRQAKGASSCRVQVPAL